MTKNHDEEDSGASGGHSGYEYLTKKEVTAMQKSIENTNKRLETQDIWNRWQKTNYKNGNLWAYRFQKRRVEQLGITEHKVEWSKTTKRNNRVLVTGVRTGRITKEDIIWMILWRKI